MKQGKLLSLPLIRIILLMLPLLTIITLFLTSCSEIETGKRTLPDGSEVQVDITGKTVRDRRAEAAEKAISSIRPEHFEDVKGTVHSLHLQLNDLVGWGHFRRFEDKNGSKYLWEVRVASYLGENSLVARARDIAMKVESELFKQDLESFAQAIELAYEKRDVTSSHP